MPGAIAGAGRAPAPGEPALVVEEVAVRFGGIAALDGVTLELGPGEVVGLVGANGAGKTTLLDVIGGFLPGATGKVILGGEDLTTASAPVRAARGLGRSFQDARLFPSLTVEDTIRIALDRWTDVRDPLLAALHAPAVFDSEEAVSARVDELVALLGLEAFRNKFVGELSTGSRRIVDLACVVAHRPTVVLLDEPSSGIAQRETEALVPVIRSLAEELGAAVLLVEHDMPLVTAVADRLVALDRGRVIASGTSGEVLRHPDVVASYLGTEGASYRGAGDGASPDPKLTMD